jgi:hypothetical protein
MAQGDIVPQRLDALERRVESLEAERRLEKRYDIIQLLVIIVTLIGSLYGAAYYLGEQNRRLVESLRNEMKTESSRLDKRFDDTNRRIDDLKQVVLASQQKRGQ